MEPRIRFQSAEVRKEFFLTARKGSNTQSWKDLAKQLELKRSPFQEYRCGKRLSPKSLYEKLETYVPADKKPIFIKNIKELPGNWGASKGGKTTLKKHPEILELGRKNNKEKRFERALLPIIMNIELSEQLCEFIGAIIGDGNVDGHLKKNGLSNYHISITGHSTFDKDYLTRHIPGLVKSLFSIDCKFYYRKDCNALNMNLNSKKVFHLLTNRFNFIAGNKTHTVKIPKEITDFEERFMFSTIRGIFDTDGCIFFDKRKGYKTPYPRIVIQVVSEPLFLQLKEFLGTHFSLYTQHHEKRKMYCLDIYGHMQFHKWMDLIGFSNEKHLSRIKELQMGIAPITSASLKEIGQAILIPMPRN
ncbi:MAG: LAGLIDADG family homing endonuclease [archaeon]